MVTLNKKLFKNKKVLITGNSGFIGSWLSLYLLNLQCNVYGISSGRFNKNNIFNLLNLKNKIKNYNINLTNEKHVKKFLKGKKFDIIFHLAAEPLVYDGFINPKKMILNNINSTLNVLDYFRENKKTVLINFTTDKVYKNDDKKNIRFKENDKLGGLDPYSFSKSAVDLMTTMWNSTYFNKKNIFKYCNLRSGNIIGGGDWNDKRIMVDIVKHHFLKKKIYIRQPNSYRPWIHVVEACLSILLITQGLIKNPNLSGDYNIGPNPGQEKNIKWIFQNSLKILKTKNKKNNIKKNIKKFPEKSFLGLNNKKFIKKFNLNFKLKTFDRLKFTLDWYYVFFKNKKEIENFTYNQIELIHKKLNLIIKKS